MGGRGNAGGRNNTAVKEAPWSYVYNTYRNEINSATELSINPDNGHAVFSALEAPVTPVITDFIRNSVGTDKQLREFYQKEYPRKAVNIVRSKYI